MMLIGQYDSPFVRRVGIALTTYGMVFEHRPWSVFGDADKIAAYNSGGNGSAVHVNSGEMRNCNLRRDQSLAKVFVNAKF